MKRNRYDESFKSEAVSLALSGELSYAEVARDLGVNYATLTNWIYTAMSIPSPQAKLASPVKPVSPTIRHLNANFKPPTKNWKCARGRSSS